MTSKRLERREVWRPLDGVFRVPPSKSLTNRALVAAAVAGGGEVLDPLDCEDTRLLARALEAAGWGVHWADPRRASVTARRDRQGSVTVDLGNSGTGARLMLALLAATDGRFVVDGSPRLRERPMGPLLQALEQLGARLEAAPGGRLPVRIEGRHLSGGSVHITPAVSSQFVSALLLAAPAMASDLRLVVLGELPSAPYIGLTQAVLSAFGGRVEGSGDGHRWRVAAAGLRPSSYRVEGDWSAAAFGVAAAAVVGGSVEVTPLAPDSRQGDRAVCDLLAAAGVGFAQQGDSIRSLLIDLAKTEFLFRNFNNV